MSASIQNRQILVKTHNLFISHSWNYSDAFERLNNLLDSKSYFAYMDYSVPKHDPVHTNGTDKELAEAIKNHMQPCHVVIVLAGIYSSYSKWISKEIDIAKSGFSNSKPILAIEPWGSERTSKLVKDSADDIVKWNSNSIVAAIRNLSDA